MTKETFYKEAKKARKAFKEEYDGRDIFEYYIKDSYEKARYTDYFTQYFTTGSIVGFSDWPEEDYFCTWYSDAIKKIIMIDADAYLSDESWEEYLNSLWKYQEEAQELEATLKK